MQKIVIIILSILLILVSFPTVTSENIEKASNELKILSTKDLKEKIEKDNTIPPLSFVLFFILGIFSWILEPIRQLILFIYFITNSSTVSAI